MITPDKKNWIGCLIAFCAVFWGLIATAETSTPFANEAVTARLITAENAVAPNAGSLSVGLDLELGEGWKTYWRSPGEVGLPPEIDWSGSTNIASAEIMWPAPERFTAFGIENFGYSERVVLPVRITLERPGEPANLNAQVFVLTCEEICVPHDFPLSLELPNGTGIDTASAELITTFAARVPAQSTADTISLTSTYYDSKTLVVTAESQHPFTSPDLFPELGAFYALGAPDIRLSENNTKLWASFPVLAEGDGTSTVSVTITDTKRAVSASTNLGSVAAVPPYDIAEMQPGLSQMLWIVIIAFAGGVILNVMPCVLPVLSIKLASVLANSNQPAAVVRTGFLISALGVMAFMWTLAAIILILQSIGFSVGWGLQFQNPVFITIMFVILTIFAANLFGAFEIQLPSGLQTKLAGSSGRSGYIGDFATGAFGAILATPCSAPFLGTAIAFAMSGRAIDVLVVFTALGVGLALPYLIFAAWPSLMAKMPKPGRWMLLVKFILGILLAATAAWLLWILLGVSGVQTATIVLGLTLVFVALATWSFGLGRLRTGVLAILAIAPLIAAGTLTPTLPVPTSTDDSSWIAFDRSAIPRLVSQGNTVFVDVTADWCLTCKANKALVLDRDPVRGMLQLDGVVAMRADWTRPDPMISAYLETHQRFGIPFNIIYGPQAPNGIPLSELLSTEDVTSALLSAGARVVATANP